MFSIYTELQRPSMTRMNKVVRRSLQRTQRHVLNAVATQVDRAQLLCFLVYVLIGFFGYVHFAQDTAPDILNNVQCVRAPL